MHKDGLLFGPSPQPGKQNPGCSWQYKHVGNLKAEIGVHLPLTEFSHTFQASDRRFRQRGHVKFQRMRNSGSSFWVVGHAASMSAINPRDLI